MSAVQCSSGSLRPVLQGRYWLDRTVTGQWQGNLQDQSTRKTGELSFFIMSSSRQSHQICYLLYWQSPCYVSVSSLTSISSQLVLIVATDSDADDKTWCRDDTPCWAVLDTTDIHIKADQGSKLPSCGLTQFWWLQWPVGINPTSIVLSHYSSPSQFMFRFVLLPLLTLLTLLSRWTSTLSSPAPWWASSTQLSPRSRLSSPAAQTNRRPGCGTGSSSGSSPSWSSWPTPCWTLWATPSPSTWSSSAPSWSGVWSQSNGTAVTSSSTRWDQSNQTSKLFIYIWKVFYLSKFNLLKIEELKVEIITSHRKTLALTKVLHF